MRKKGIFLNTFFVEVYIYDDDDDDDVVVETGEGFRCMYVHVRITCKCDHEEFNYKHE